MAVRNTRRRRARAQAGVTLFRRTRRYDKVPPIPRDAVSSYADALKGLRVAPRDRAKLVRIFKSMTVQLARTRAPRAPFLRGIKALHDAIGHATAGKRLSPVRAELALKVPWAILCQWLGCTVCISGGWGRLDRLLVGCHPGFSGWTCLYLAMPSGFCRWAGL
jgi:hypothetical protein